MALARQEQLFRFLRQIQACHWETLLPAQGSQTLPCGRGLRPGPLAALLVERGPFRIRFLRKAHLPPLVKREAPPNTKDVLSTCRRKVRL